jgi:hypothetical protein
VPADLAAIGPILTKKTSQKSTAGYLGDSKATIAYPPGRVKALGRTRCLKFARQGRSLRINDKFSEIKLRFKLFCKIAFSVP